MQVSSACLHGVYTSDIARRGEAGPQYSSSFPPFSRFFQVSRLLPAYNLNRWSFWGTYLTTSDPKHKEHTYFSYLLCLRKLFKKNFHFCLFLKFWTEVEEYLLNNTVFIFESSPHDGLCPHSPVSAPTQVLVIITSSPVLTCSCRVSSDGDEPGRKRDHHGSSLLLPGSQGPGIQGRWCGPGSPKRGNSKKQHWAPPPQSLLSAS